MLSDQAENELTLAACVTCVNERINIFTFYEFLQYLEARFRFGDRTQIKVRGNNRQISKRPLTPLDIKFFGRGDF